MNIITYTDNQHFVCPECGQELHWEETHLVHPVEIERTFKKSLLSKCTLAGKKFNYPFIHLTERP